MKMINQSITIIGMEALVSSVCATLAGWCDGNCIVIRVEVGVCAVCVVGERGGVVRW